MISIVYKITNSVDDRLYIGSTTQSLNQRFSQHKKNATIETRKGYNGALYVAMRELGIDKFHIEVIETVECKDKDQLHQHEQKHIDEIKPVFNYQRAHNTEADKIETRKQYYINNKDKIHVYAISTERRESMKTYQQENKEKLKKYKAELFKKQKANAVSCECECGGHYKDYTKKQHLKSKKRITWMTLQ